MALTNTLEQLILEDHAPEMSTIKRMTHSSSVASALEASGDIVLPIWLPPSFAEFANTTIEGALRDAGLLNPERVPSLKRVWESDADVLVYDNSSLFLWRIDPLTMWQQLDRRLDE